MGLGYSTCREIVNQVLLSNGFKAIAADSNFANVSSTDKYQRAMIIWLQQFQRRFSLIFNSSRFMQRKFTFTTNGVDTQYQPDPTNQIYPIEGFKPNSFFNVTASGPANGRLHVVTWSQWRQAYPNPEQVSRGFPIWLVPVPEDGTDIVKVMLFPYPSAAYTIEGQGRIEAPDITDGAQKVLFPKHYEHLLFYHLKLALEQAVNEGREYDHAAAAEQVLLEVMRDAPGAEEEQEITDIGVRILNNPDGWGSRRDFNPATDIPPPFTGL